MMSGRKRSQAVRGTVLTANLPPAIKARQEAANRVDPNKIQPKPTLKETISQEISKRTLPIPDALSPAIIFHFETLLEGLAEMKLKGEQLVNFRYLLFSPSLPHSQF